MKVRMIKDQPRGLVSLRYGEVYEVLSSESTNEKGWVLKNQCCVSREEAVLVVEKPTPEQLKKFISLFGLLLDREAELRHTHPHLGFFSTDQTAKFPDRDVVAVMEWLKELSNG